MATPVPRPVIAIDSQAQQGDVSLKSYVEPVQTIALARVSVLAKWFHEDRNEMTVERGKLQSMKCAEEG